MTLPGVNGELMVDPDVDDSDPMSLLLYTAACSHSDRSTLVQLFNAHTPVDPPIWSEARLKQLFADGRPAAVFSDRDNLGRQRRAVLDLAGESPEIKPFFQFLQPREPPPPDARSARRTVDISRQSHCFRLDTAPVRPQRLGTSSNG